MIPFADLAIKPGAKAVLLGAHVTVTGAAGGQDRAPLFGSVRAYENNRLYRFFGGGEQKAEKSEPQ